MNARDRLTLYRDALEKAKSDYELADYIDSTLRRDRERAALMIRIKALEQKISDWSWIIHNDLFGPIDGDNP